MNDSTREKWAKSLTAESTDLLPYLPYLLQDLWGLGGDPQEIEELVRKYVTEPRSKKFLDLACGKGEISISVARIFGSQVVGIDLTEEFIQVAREKAKEYGVEDLCHFYKEDVNVAVQKENGYDGVIFSASGDILGSPKEMLRKLSSVIKSNGFIFLDESFLKEEANQEILYQNYEYLRGSEWEALFHDLGLKKLEQSHAKEEEVGAIGQQQVEQITMRAKELADKHPAKKDLFESYIQSQKNECFDIENTLENVIWVLQKE